MLPHKKQQNYALRMLLNCINGSNIRGMFVRQIKLRSKSTSGVGEDYMLEIDMSKVFWLQLYSCKAGAFFRCAFSLIYVINLVQ